MPSENCLLVFLICLIDHCLWLSVKFNKNKMYRKNNWFLVYAQKTYQNKKKIVKTV